MGHQELQRLANSTSGAYSGTSRPSSFSTITLWIATTFCSRSAVRNRGSRTLHCGLTTRYKISNELLEIESFHSRSERQFESRAGEAGRPPLRANYNHSLGAAERKLGALLLHQAPQLRDTMNRVLEYVARSPQWERPGRSYPRRSRRPGKKWRNRRPADPPTAD